MQKEAKEQCITVGMMTTGYDCQDILNICLMRPVEEIFLPQSHGYRPNTNAHAAVRKGEVFIRRGYHWVVDADIEGFFDHVDHQIMMDLVCEKVADGRVLSLIESFLKSGIMNDGVFEESIEGTPQGGNIRCT